MTETAPTTPSPHRALRPASRRKALLLAALSASLASLVPGTARAHEHLVRSAPARGDTLDRAPSEIRLVFSGRVELAFSGIELLDSAGRAIPLAPLRSPADSAAVLIAPLNGPLAPGRYTVAWRTGGADGHPVRGRYDFLVAPGVPAFGVPVADSGAALDSTAAARASSAEHAGHGEHEGHDMPEMPAEGSADGSLPGIAIRWLALLSLVGVVGVAAFRPAVLGRGASGTPGALPPALVDDASRRARSLGLVLAGLLLAAVLARLALQWSALDDGVGGVSLGGVLGSTEWGWGWLLQLAGTLLALAGLLAAHRTRAGWSLLVVAALALSLSGALSGHAAATEGLAPLTILADAAHVLGAGVWLGTLLVVVAAGLPAALDLPEGERGPAAALLVRRFSPVALGAAATLVASGIVAAWAQLRSFDALLGSRYGQALLWKLAFVLLVAALGAFHWRRAIPGLGSEAAARRMRRTAATELALAAWVLLITAVLVVIPPPR